MTFDPPGGQPGPFGPIDGPPPPIGYPPPGYPQPGYPPPGPVGYPQPGGPPPYGTMPVPSKTSGTATASLVLGLIGLFTCVVVIVPLAAIILGILGVRGTSADSPGVKGRGMAISGIVLGAIGMVVGAMSIVFFAGGHADSFFDDLYVDPVETFAVGTCTQNPDVVDYYELTEMSCGTTHGGEVFLAKSLGGSNDPYPGDNSMYDDTWSACVVEFESYVGSDYEESELDIFPIFPDRFEWDLGDRSLVCIAFQYDDSDLPPGTVKDSGR